MWIDFVSDVVAILSFDLKPLSRQNFLILKISSFLEVMFAMLFANTSNSGVCTVNCSPRIYIPLAYVSSLCGNGIGTQLSQGEKPGS